jgi:hypothetical protein
VALLKLESPLDWMPVISQKRGWSRARLAWFWQASKAEEEGSYGLQSQDATEDQDSSQDRRQIPSRQGSKGRHSRGKEAVWL